MSFARYFETSCAGVLGGARDEVHQLGAEPAATSVQGALPNVDGPHHARSIDFHSDVTGAGPRRYSNVVDGGLLGRSFSLRSERGVRHPRCGQATLPGFQTSQTPPPRSLRRERRCRKCSTVRSTRRGRLANSRWLSACSVSASAGSGAHTAVKPLRTVIRKRAKRECARRGDPVQAGIPIEINLPDLLVVRGDEARGVRILDARPPRPRMKSRRRTSRRPRWALLSRRAMLTRFWTA